MIYNRKNKRDRITYWFIRYDLPDGRRRKEKAGTTRRDAVELLTKRKAEILKGEYVDPRDRQKASQTVSKAVTEFLESYRGKAGQLRSNYYEQALTVERSLVAFLGDRKIRTITQRDCEEFRAWLLVQQHGKSGRRLGSTTVRKKLMGAGTFFGWAKRCGKIDANPMDDVEKPAEAPPRARAFTHEEWRRISTALVPDERQIATMALATAQSLGDITGLEWDCVDLHRGFVYFERAKSRERYHVALGQVALEVLQWAQGRRKQIAKLTGQLPRFVFVDSRGAAYHSTLRRRNAISQHFRAACRCRGISWGTFKALRTTAATWADEAGASIESIQRALGHADIRTTQRFYVRAGVRSQVEKTSATISAIDDLLRGSRFGTKLKPVAVSR